MKQISKGLGSWSMTSLKIEITNE